MLKKMNPQQLQSLSLEEIKAYKETAVKGKTELEALKAKGGKDWTAELQEELDDIALLLVDVDEVIEKKQSEASSAANDAYVVKPGTENMVHLSIVKGRRFNPLTGKEESKPYNQIFSYSEWQLFKNNHRGLGYFIMKVLHDPYNEAEKYVYKQK